MAPDLRPALAALRTALDDLAVPAMVIGGIAVIVRGVARTTRDIDATVRAPGLEIPEVLTRFEKRGIGARIGDALTFAQAHQVLLLLHGETGVPIDLSFAWLPFEWEALAAATEEDFDGVPIRVATAEDLIVMKSVAMREQDRLDILDLLVRHGDRVRLDRIRRLVAEFAAVLEAPERVAQLEDLVQRAR